jgi:hypothetical protein
MSTNPPKDVVEVASNDLFAKELKLGKKKP